MIDSAANLVEKLRALVESYEESMDIDTGDEVADENYALGLSGIIGEIKSLLNGEDLMEGFDLNCDSERPFIPMGFQLYSVASH